MKKESNRKNNRTGALHTGRGFGRRRAAALALLLTLLLALAALAGCGASEDSAETTAASVDYGVTRDVAAGTDEVYAEDTYIESESVTEEATESEVTDSASLSESSASGRKLIRTVSLTLESENFDTALQEIQDKATATEGYVETSDVSGVSYYNEGSAYSRYASLTLRIPADRLDEFITVVSGYGNVTYKSESVEDITLNYVDVESRKKALETEETRLLELMEQAENVEDVITIEERLSEIRYELENYESTLRTYDNQVDYSTVYVYLEEVQREQSVSEEPGILGEIRAGFANNLYKLGQSLRSLLVWFVVSLPYLLVLALVIFLVVRLLQKIFGGKPFFRRRARKGKGEAVEEAAASVTEPEVPAEEENAANLEPQADLDREDK